MFTTSIPTPEAESVSSLRGQLAEINGKMEYHASNLQTNSRALRQISIKLKNQTPGVTVLGETLAALRRKGTIEEHVEESRHQLGRLKIQKADLVNRTRQLLWGTV